MGRGARRRLVQMPARRLRRRQRTAPPASTPLRDPGSYQRGGGPVEGRGGVQTLTRSGRCSASIRSRSVQACGMPVPAQNALTASSSMPTAATASVSALPRQSGQRGQMGAVPDGTGADEGRPDTPAGEGSRRSGGTGLGRVGTGGPGREGRGRHGRAQHSSGTAAGAARDCSKRFLTGRTTRRRANRSTPAGGAARRGPADPGDPPPPVPATLTSSLDHSFTSPHWDADLHVLV